MNSYQEFIAKSRYSRYLPNEFRREHWPETVDRWIEFFKKENPEIISTSQLWDELSEAMKALAVLGSMRTVMTAGEALDRTHVAAYNCSYLPIDDWRCFDEAMYILLCGTGVGFSVESKYTNKLAAIPATIKDLPEIVIKVEDSKEGWCHAYRELIAGLFTGMCFSWDVSAVRPAGAPLKTFGGRASGPDPLVRLFKYTVDKFKGAAGRKLTPLEAHDIMCKIGEVVVVGGVRRSAMISLGDLHDYEHANAKTGQWWTNHSERALANNSAVYNHRPSIGEFMQEWLNIYNSHSGERGIFNREASQKQASKWSRRDPSAEYGTNPCSEIILKPYQFCNLSTIVVRPDDNIFDLEEKIRLATIIGTMQSRLTKFPYLRDVWRHTTEEERLLGVSMTGVFSNTLFTGDRETRKRTLRHLREVARKTNKIWAERLGIPESTAITCIKPEGTVSQLTLTESGIHPAHNDFYIRRVRQDMKDPLTQFLIAEGIPHEPDVNAPQSTMIFSFPMKMSGITRHDISAIEHLEIWLDFQREYCEHKPSITVYIKEDEWPEVGAWVWKHFDECTGIAFLPHDGGTYVQAPYEDITEEQYNELASKMPNISWDRFIEIQDNVEGAQMLACTAGGCSI
jgi:ribonucleoside-triphosphate reductase